MKIKEPLYLKYCHVHILCVWVMLQKLPVNNFEWIEDTFQFNSDFIKSCNEKSDEGYFLEVDPEKLHELHNYLPFYQKERKLKKSKNLFLIYVIIFKYVNLREFT